jgi:hypothetical protein
MDDAFHSPPIFYVKDIIAQKYIPPSQHFFCCGYRVLTFSLFPIYLYDSILMFAQHQQVRQFMDIKEIKDTGREGSAIQAEKMAESLETTKLVGVEFY